MLLYQSWTREAQIDQESFEVDAIEASIFMLAMIETHFSNHGKQV